MANKRVGEGADGGGVGGLVPTLPYTRLTDEGGRAWVVGVERVIEVVSK